MTNSLDSSIEILGRLSCVDAVICREIRTAVAKILETQERTMLSRKLALTRNFMLMSPKEIPTTTQPTNSCQDWRRFRKRTNGGRNPVQHLRFHPAWTLGL